MSKEWNNYLDMIRESKPFWNCQVTASEAIEQQRRLDASQGINNPFLGMSWNELKKLGHGFRTSVASLEK